MRLSLVARISLFILLIYVLKSRLQTNSHAQFSTTDTNSVHFEIHHHGRLQCHCSVMYIIELSIAYF